MEQIFYWNEYFIGLWPMQHSLCENFPYKMLWVEMHIIIKQIAILTAIQLAVTIISQSSNKEWNI
jgi:hypothetical protein